MTVRLTPLARAATACGLAAAAIASTSSCSSQPPAPDEQLASYAAASRPAALRIVQMGYGREAFFAVCAAPPCTAATPKTPPAAAALPARALPQRVAPPVAAPATGSAGIALPVAHGTSDVQPTPPLAHEAPAHAPAPVPAATAHLPPPASSVSTRTPPHPPAAAASTHERARATRILVGFAFGSADLSDAARHTIRSALPRARESDRIVIAGRTDGTGPEEVNRRLALARALAVRDYLRDVVPDLPNVISIDARGSCCFVADNDSANGRRMNRRVEVSFVDTGAM